MEEENRPGLDVIHVTIRPMDGDWCMGENLQMSISKAISVNELMRNIKSRKGISEFRQQIRLSNGSLIPISRQAWGLRQHGISDGALLFVEPTIPNGWLWHDIEFYRQELIQVIHEQIRRSGGKIELKSLEILVQRPPPITTSLAVFIRRYPEVFYVHTDITSNKMWIFEIQYAGQLPSFSLLPPRLAEYYRLDEVKLDLDAQRNIDVDDCTGNGIVEYHIPDQHYRIAVVEAAGLFKIDPVEFSNPFAVLFLNGKEIGTTSIAPTTCNPKWGEGLINGDICEFKVVLGAMVDLKSCKLRVDIWSAIATALKEGVVQNSRSFLGTVELRPPDVYKLIGGGTTAQMTIDVILPSSQSQHRIDNSGSGVLADSVVSATTSHTARDESINKRRASTETVSYKSTLAASGKIAGSITLRGCSEGYEVCIHSGRNLLFQSEDDNDIYAQKALPFALLLWNGRELGCTRLGRSNHVNPTWESVFRIPLNESSDKPLNESTLEVQVWVSDPSDKSCVFSKGTFLGDIILANLEAADLLTRNNPYATRLRCALLHQPKQKIANTLPSSHEEAVFSLSRPSVLLLGGLSGLREQRTKLLELLLQTVCGLPSQFSRKYHFIVDWCGLLYETAAVPLAADGSHVVSPGPHSTAMCPDSNGVILCARHVFKIYNLLEKELSSIAQRSLRLELWASAEEDQDFVFVGQLTLSESDIVELMDQRFAVEKSFLLTLPASSSSHPHTSSSTTVGRGSAVSNVMIPSVAMPPPPSAAYRRNPTNSQKIRLPPISWDAPQGTNVTVTLRGGSKSARKEQERVLIVKAMYQESAIIKGQESELALKNRNVSIAKLVKTPSSVLPKLNQMKKVTSALAIKKSHFAKVVKKIKTAFSKYARKAGGWARGFSSLISGTSAPDDGATANRRPDTGNDDVGIAPANRRLTLARGRLGNPSLGLLDVASIGYSVAYRASRRFPAVSATLRKRGEGRGKGKNKAADQNKLVQKEMRPQLYATVTFDDKDLGSTPKVYSSTKGRSEVFAWGEDERDSNCFFLPHWAGKRSTLIIEIWSTGSPEDVLDTSVGEIVLSSDALNNFLDSDDHTEISLNLSEFSLWRPREGRIELITPGVSFATIEEWRADRREKKKRQLS